MNKTDLIQKLKQLEGLSKDEKAELINLVNNNKKYGLVWEDKPEHVEEQLRENLPVFREVKDKAIVNGDDYPNHILIEGDNLHALTALSFTHEGKIDVIYIDPPYNTGNKDFKYNDSFVDKEDSYRHSKWLSFMSKRLEIAKRLLSEKGVIFISIDDNEQAQLKLLCDEEFGELYFVANFLWKKKGTSTNVTGVQVSSLTDYILCYKKSKQAQLVPRIKLAETRSYPSKDNIGNYRTAIIEKKNSGGYKRDTMIFEIMGHKPRKGKRWQIGENTARELEKRKRFLFENGILKLKIYDFEDNDTTSAHPNVLESHGSSDSAARMVNVEILGVSEKFNNPKPIELLMFIIKVSNKDNYSTILDFFAGSGTTLHATMQLNAEDGGNRQCILVTNNENNICEEVTYERNKRVIQGYPNSKGVEVEGLKNNNLRYYKSEFVSRNPSMKNKKQLTKLATELLCIKEDIYESIKMLGEYKLNASYVKCFHNGGNYLLIIYDEEVIAEIVEVVKNAISITKEEKLQFKIYVFSNGQYPYTEEFEDVLDYVTLCALPDAIYKAYKNVLPKKTRKATSNLEDSNVEEIEKQGENINYDLFNQS